MGFLKTTKGRIFILAAVLIIAAVVFLFSFLGKEKGYRTISVSEIYGKVTVENGGNRYDAYKNMALSDGYGLITDKASYTRMLLDDDKFIKLEEESYAKFEALGKNGSGNTVIRLEHGKITNEITTPLSPEEDYVIHTPNAVLAVRGTFFIVQVTKDMNGEYITNVLTYGGKVLCKRVMPDGTIVDEEVYIEAGYKTTVGMDASKTFYIIEQTDDEHKNTEPIDISDISDDELVEIYNATLNGHEMFMVSEEIEAEIEKRGIDLSLYYSKYDGSEIPDFDRNDQPETTTEATTTALISSSYSDTTTVTTSISTEESTSGTEQTIPHTTSTIITTSPKNDSTQSATSAPIPVTTTVSEETSAITEIVTSDEPETIETTLTKEITTSVKETATTPDSDWFAPSTTVPVTTSETAISSAVIFTEVTATSTEATTTEPAHECVFTDYVLLSEATCTENEMYIATCECGKTDIKETEGTASGHTETEENIPATLGSDGYYRLYCSVCGEDLAEKIIYPMLSSLDCADGQIMITSTGYTQGESSEEIPYTGEYTIKGNAVGDEVLITVSDGTPVITIDGNNSSSVMKISSGAEVTLKGNSALMKNFDNEGSIVLDGGVISFSEHCTNSGSMTVSNGDISFSDGISNIGGTINIEGGNIVASQNEGVALLVEGGSVNISGGTVTTSADCTYGISISSGNISITGGVINLSGTMQAFLNWGGTVEVSGGKIISDGIINNTDAGTITVSGGSVTTDTLYTSDNRTVVSGGSFCVTGTITGGGNIVADETGTPTDSVVYSTYDEYIVAQVEVYSLDEEDASTDGKYYVWQPQIAATAEKFPDAAFLNWILDNCDTNDNGYLSISEIAYTTILDAGTDCGSAVDFTGIGYLKKLEELTVNNNSVTSLDLSKNTFLKMLSVSGTGLTYLDVSGNTSLTYLDCSYTSVTEIDLSKNTELTDFNCMYSKMEYLDLSGNTKLSSLSVTSCPLRFVVLPDVSILSLNADYLEFDVLSSGTDAVTIDISAYEGMENITLGTNMTLSGTSLILSGGLTAYTYTYTHTPSGNTLTFTINVINE